VSLTILAEGKTMLLAQLIDGPLHGETIEVGASTKIIEVDLGDGTFGSYSENGAGYWQYGGAKRVGETGNRRVSIPIQSSTYTTPKI
jgi:hypothetical protein